jgi:hypothetical protein
VRIAFLGSGTSGINAIDQWSDCLIGALRDRGHSASLHAWQPGSLFAAGAAPDVLVLPYNPFMWGRWGFAPLLVRDVLSVRRRRPRPVLVLAIHEPYVPVRDAKSLLMGAWQRLQLWSLLLLVDRRFASIDAWSRRFGRIAPTGHLPSGSNVPDARTERDRARAQLGAEEALVVATLSTGNPSHLGVYVEETLDLLATKARRETLFLRLGAGAPEVTVPPHVRQVAPGYVTAPELGAYLAAADLLLTPFGDGVSTRRGSFMAGLCEGVCVIGTLGRLTDPSLVDVGLELVPVGDSARFAERANTLAEDDTRRAASAARGRALFEAEFTWDAVAARLLEAVG